MGNELNILLITAASIGFFHTLLGPDHYLPFIVMSKARDWSYARTMWITFLCGLGHVGSSVVIGLAGIAFGIGLSRLELFEGVRGSLAAWALALFGVGYFIWGLWKAKANKPHKHLHMHEDGQVHAHEHTHGYRDGHLHSHNITPWILFTIFVLGPCEPLIPLLMFPAAQNSLHGLVMVTAVFSVITIATMMTLTSVAWFGIGRIPFGKAERYMHAMAGAVISLSGFSIIFLGL